MMRVLLALVLVLVLAGCGGARQDEPTLASSTSRDVVCRTEMPTGSHLPRTTCYSREEIERAREAARRGRDRARAQ